MEEHPLQVCQQVDLWSLGCVFSEVATWIVGGWPKVKEYRSRRQQEAAKRLGKDHGEIFHDGHKLLEVVGQSHDSVIRSSRRDDFVTERVLLGPVAEMLQEEPMKRKECQRLLGRTDEIVSQAGIDLQTAADKARSGAPQTENSPSNSAPIEPQPELLVPALQNPANTRHNIRQKGRTPPILDDSSGIAKKKSPPSLSLEFALDIKNLKTWPIKANFPHERLLVNLNSMHHVSRYRDPGFATNIYLDFLD